MAASTESRHRSPVENRIKLALERDLALTIVIHIGDYLIDSASAYQPDRPLRLCKAYDNRAGRITEIYVSDPQGRLDGICSISPSDTSRATSLNLIPEIILSENYRELEAFSFDSNEGSVKLPIDGITYSIEVLPNVRKPGQIPLVTLQIMARQVERISATRKRVRLWDIGCGSGFLGLLGMRLLGDKMEAVICSDVSESAVDCTRRNIENLRLEDDRIRVSRGDLFEGSASNCSQDLIVFNPPFSPDGLPGLHRADVGGTRGIETALRFCRGAKQFIRPGGSALLAIADYVDGGQIRETLSQHFGARQVDCDERLILYPYDPPKPIPQAHEIRFLAELERTGYRFQTCFIGTIRFLAFTLRHYCAVKA